jgi:hypothetical protein
LPLARDEFFERLHDRLRAILPPDLNGFVAHANRHQTKLHYGEPRIHYEVWLVGKTQLLEVGLHFEADPDTNLAWLEFLIAHQAELIAELGPAYELERWTASWTRLHRCLPLRPLDDAYLDEVAEELAWLIEAAQPLIAEGGSQIPPPASALAISRGHPGRDRSRRW